MNQKIMISGYDKTTVMAQPWAEAGYLCYCIDIQHPKGETRDGNIIRVGHDMLDWLPPWGGDIAFQAYFPPCTDLSVSGARWFKNKGLGALSHAVELFGRAVRLSEYIGAPYMIENPVSTISTYYRKPDHTFNPCQYAGYLEDMAFDEAYTKKTCLWTGGGFKMPEPLPLKAVLGSKMHLLPPSDDRADLRSATPIGFARAVFEANHCH